MLKILNQKLDLITAKRFRVIAPLLSICSDIILLLYINGVMLPKIVNERAIRFALAKANGVLPEQLTQDFVVSATQMMLSSLSLMLTCIFICHLVLYALCLTKHTWPRTYIMGYAGSAVFLSFFELLFYIYSESRLNFVTLITMILYFIVAHGYKYFRKKSEL
jgi:hypothetical protein